jgi:hypothetical protein
MLHNIFGSIHSSIHSSCTLRISISVLLKIASPIGFYDTTFHPAVVVTPEPISICEEQIQSTGCHRSRRAVRRMVAASGTIQVSDPPRTAATSTPESATADSPLKTFRLSDTRTKTATPALVPR